MATPVMKVLLHQHCCPQCKIQYHCDQLACCPDKPGITARACEACSSHPPKTLLELKHELMDGRNELYTQFMASVVEQTELTPEQQKAVGGYLAGAVEKRDRLADFIKGLEEEAGRLRKRELELAQRREEFERLAKMFRGSILMQLTNWKDSQGCKMITRVDGLESSFRVRKNPHRVEVFDEAALPGKFINYVPQFDKTAIATALERGEQVPGARWGDQTYSLQIR